MLVGEKVCILGSADFERHGLSRKLAPTLYLLEVIHLNSNLWALVPFERPIRATEVTQLCSRMGERSTSAVQYCSMMV